MAVYRYSNNPSTTLSGSVTAVATSITVASATGFPTQGKFTIIVDSEIMLVTGVAGTVWTVERGAESTTAASHTNNSAVVGILTKGSFLDANWFDVRNYGATGDGATDDVTAINAALTAASDAGGGIVWFPPGNYIISTSIAPGSNTTLMGAGAATKITQATTDNPVISVNTKSKVVVRDMWIVGGNNAARTNNRGVHFNTVTDGLIENVRAQNCYDGISLFTSSAVTVRNCYIQADVSAGTDAAIRVSDCDRLEIVGNFVDTPPAHGIGVGTTSTDVVIDGNHVWSAGNTAIVVSGHPTTGTGPGFTITNNVIRDSAWGIIIENGAAYVRCSNNFIYNSTNDGILVSDGTGDAPVHILIASNVIRDAGRYGIFNNGAAYITIEGNHVTVFVDDGIRCGAGAGCKVIGNTVTDGTASTGDAIVIYASLIDAVVSGNLVRNTAGEGIVIDAASAAVTGNTVIDADNGGVLTTGGIRLSSNASRTTVVGNNSRRVTGTKQDYGIVIDAGCTNAMVVGNNLFQNTTAASLDNGTGTTLANNIIA